MQSRLAPKRQNTAALQNVAVLAHSTQLHLGVRRCCAAFRELAENLVARTAEAFHVFDGVLAVRLEAFFCGDHRWLMVER